MKVYTHFAGSDCVVYQDANAHHHDARYIDARRDVRQPHMRTVELVHAGCVVWQDKVGLCDAPAIIVRIMRNGFNPPGN
jgi:hypothetical protein